MSKLRLRSNQLAQRASQHSLEAIQAFSEVLTVLSEALQPCTPYQPMKGRTYGRIVKLADWWLTTPLNDGMMLRSSEDWTCSKPDTIPKLLSRSLKITVLCVRFSDYTGIPAPSPTFVIPCFPFCSLFDLLALISSALNIFLLQILPFAATMARDCFYNRPTGHPYYETES